MMSIPPEKRRWPTLVIAGCALAAACACLAAGAAAAYVYFTGRPASAVEPTVEYVLDSSPRMDSPSRGGDPRYLVARGVLAEIVRTADPRLTAGLRVFGTGAVSRGCQDTDLVVPLAASNQGTIEGELGAIAPASTSDSAMAEAMIAAIRDVASTDGPHSIVVVTGGADLCNPEAGELIRQEADRAGIELRMFVVGFEVPPDEIEAVKGLVELIPGATYTDAPQPAALRTALAGIQTEVDLMAEEAFEPRPELGAGTSAHACDHPYLPLRTGASWSYATTEGAYTWSVTSASGSAEAASATMDFSVPEVSWTVHWTCSPAGITSYDFGTISSSVYGAIASVDITSSSGSWLPAAESMVPGFSWSNDYTTVASTSVEGFSMETTATTSESWTVAGFGTVATSAGTFDALRIDGTATTTLTSSSFGIDIPASTWSQSFWLVEGVGIVRYTTSGEGYSSSAELTAYSLP